MENVSSGYWAFQANPRMYEIERAITELEYDIWTTKNHDVRAGDYAIIWKSLGGTKDRGVLGFAEVLDEPAGHILDDSPYWREGHGPTDEEKVHIHYIVPPNCPVWVNPVTEPILSRLTVYRSQGSVFRVTPEQWEAVVELAGGWLGQTSPRLDEIENDLSNELLFDPDSRVDARARALREIVLRRGQPAYRQALIEAYGGRCAITGCDVPEVLEAAHILPYRGPETNHIHNGLLLRGDIHTLFDLGQITVDEELLTVLVDPALRATAYGEFHGKPLNLPSDSSKRPSTAALRHHRLSSNVEK